MMTLAHNRYLTCLLAAVLSACDGSDVAPENGPKLTPEEPGRYDLLTEYQQSIPKYVERGGVMAGLCVEILQAIEKESGLTVGSRTAGFTPFRRLQQHLAVGDIDIFVGFKRTAERAERYLFVDPPIYTVRTLVCARAGDSDTVEAIADLEGQPVLVPGGSATAAMLKAEYPEVAVDEAGSVFICLRKLLKGRGRYVFYHDIGLIGAIKEMGIEADVAILPVVLDEYSHHVVMSTSASPEHVQKIAAAVQRLSDGGTLSRISPPYQRL